MPSQLHESLLMLFRNRPQLAPELLRMALRLELPQFEDASVDSEALNDIQPAEYRADLVVKLRDAHGAAVFGIVVEAQLDRHAQKRFSWPVYGVELRARMRCPTCVLVVCPDERVAHWARQPIELGAGSVYRLQVLGSDGVPRMGDPEEARRDPELAVLSVMAHGHERDIEAVLQLAIAAAEGSGTLDPERSLLYFDLIQNALSDAARKAFEAMDPAKYEFKSDFAKRYLAEGRTEGRTEGYAEVVLKQMSLRFGELPADVVTRVRSASLQELERYAERVLTVERLEDVLGG